MPTQRRTFLPGLLLLIGLVGGVFAPVGQFDFVRWDDDINITQNPLITAPWSAHLAGQLLGADQALRFKPVYWLYGRLLYTAVGFNAATWHWVGLGWHLLATVLFAWVLRRLLGLIGPEMGARVDLLALLGAAAWAVHPLRAETVAWATAATYPMTGALLLASFACYLQADEPGHRQRTWLGAAWGLAVLGYGCYPVGVTYGLWLVAYDLWFNPHRRGQANPRRVRWWFRPGAFLLPAVLAIAITVWSRYAEPGIFTTAPDVASIGVPTRLVVALSGLSALAWRLIWPVGLTPNLPPMNLGDAGTLTSVMLAASLAAFALQAAWQGRRKRPGVALVVFGFVALSLPCLGLTERPNWPVDRYSYLVHLILIGGVAALLLRWSGWRWGLIATGAGLLIGGEAVAARQQAMIWRNSDRLFTHMTEASGFADHPRQAAHVYILWARYLATSQEPARAAGMFNRAQAIYLTAIKAAVGREDYSEALALLSHEEHHFGLTPILRREKGAWLLRLNRPGEALRELREAAAALPGDPRGEALLQEAESALAGPLPAGR